MENFEKPEKQESDVEILKQRLVEISRDEDFNVVMKFQDRIIDFIEQIRKTHPDHEEYMMYHVLAGSTPQGECPKFDFPGEDSVETFINRLHQEYSAEKKQ